MEVEAITVSHFLGPLGGTIALAWAAGAASGYIFAVKNMKSKIEYLENQIIQGDKNCEERIKTTAERYDAELRSMRAMIVDYMKLTNELQKSVLDMKK